MSLGMLNENCNISNITKITIKEFNLFVEGNEKAIIIGINKSKSLMITIAFESFFLKYEITKEFAKYPVVNAPP